MTFATLLLQTIFSLLVIAALAYGVRLNRKLVELRDGQAAFARAVADLDGAAARAQAGLEALRVATDTAQAELADRVDEARLLAGRLEAAVSDAALSVRRLETAARARVAEPEPTGRTEAETPHRPEPIIIKRTPARPVEPAAEPAALARPSETSTERLRRVAALLRPEPEPVPARAPRAGARPGAAP